jgi:hypothetical protein
VKYGTLGPKEAGEIYLGRFPPNLAAKVKTKDLSDQVVPDPIA